MRQQTLEEVLIIVECEIACAKKYQDDLTVTMLHLSRAKYELEHAVYQCWHKHHTSGVKK